MAVAIIILVASRIFECSLRLRYLYIDSCLYSIYSAVCEQGTFGKKCKGRCDCAPGARCHPVSGRCICPKGKTGNKCDEGTDSCAR